ncbi:MAG: protein kinase [Galbitalea sp.]
MTTETTATVELLGGRYRLETVIGRGGLSTVYQAHDEMLGRKVAIKRFDVGPIDPAREEVELAILAGLDHHNLVTMLDAGSGDDGHGHRVRYIVMPLVRGMDLQERLRGSRIAARNIAEIGYDLAEALEYIHAQNVVHRDVKPSNILLVDYGNATPRARAKLTDFGIAVARDIERFTAAGVTTGTAAYLSPEQAAGEPVGAPSDIYSTGLVLLQCFTRSVEFPGTLVESAMARLSRQPRIPDYLPEHWRDLLTSMTARQPADRPAGRQLVSALRQVVIAESGRHREQAFFSSTEEADRPDVMDTIPNEALHRITAMAARLFDAPISVVSIHDENRTWLVSHYGEEVEHIVRQIDLSGPGAPRDEPFVIEDARDHPELRETPLVQPPIGIRFYAGVPLRGSNGRTLGTLSIADFRPGSVSPSQLQNLQDLAALVVAQLEARQEGFD